MYFSFNLYILEGFNVCLVVVLVLGFFGLYYCFLLLYPSSLQTMLPGCDQKFIGQTDV